MPIEEEIFEERLVERVLVEEDYVGELEPEENKIEERPEEDTLLLDVKIAALKNKIEMLSSEEEPKAPEEMYEARMDSSDALSLSIETEDYIDLPFDDNSVENTLLVEQEYEALPNESYDPEFEPKEEVIVKTTVLSQEDEIKIDDIEENKIEEEEVISETAKFLTLDAEIDENASPLEETSPVQLEFNEELEKVVSDEEKLLNKQDKSNDAISLDKNPYFNSKRLSFKGTNLILPILTVCLILGLSISIFIVLTVFK